MTSGCEGGRSPGRYKLPNMKTSSFKKILVSAGITGPILEAVTGAHRALFEGLNPQQKTRRLLRSLLPEPPGGWDSPAINADDGSEHVSTGGNVLTWIQALESHIRNALLHTRGMNDKFEPGLARIYYQELKGWPEMIRNYIGDYRDEHKDELKQMKSILGLISGYHSEEYDGDLNGMSFENLKKQFAREASESNQVAEVEDTGHTNYRIEYIPSFMVAQDYAKYMPGGREQWCITTDRRYWRDYTSNGTNTVYFLMAPGFENVPHEATEGCPKDKYGLSLIGLMVSPAGDLTSCCVRWNHAHGGSDMELNEQELGKLLGRPLRVLCPPREDENEDAEINFDFIKGKLKAGANPEELYQKLGFTDSSEIYPGLLCLKSNSCGYLIVDAATKMPAIQHLFRWFDQVNGDSNIPIYCGDCYYDYDSDREEDNYEHYMVNLERREAYMLADDDEYTLYTNTSLYTTRWPGIYRFSYETYDYDHEIFGDCDYLTFNRLVSMDGRRITRDHLDINMFGDDIIIGDGAALRENDNIKALAVYGFDSLGRIDEIIRQEEATAAVYVDGEDGIDRVAVYDSDTLYVFNQDGTRFSKESSEAEFVTFKWCDHHMAIYTDDEDDACVLLDLETMKPLLKADCIYRDGEVYMTDPDTGDEYVSLFGPDMKLLDEKYESIDHNAGLFICKKQGQGTNYFDVFDDATLEPKYPRIESGSSIEPISKQLYFTKALDDDKCIRNVNGEVVEHLGTGRYTYNSDFGILTKKSMDYGIKESIIILDVITGKPWCEPLSDMHQIISYKSTETSSIPLNTERELQKAYSQQRIYKSTAYTTVTILTRKSDGKSRIAYSLGTAWMMGDMDWTDMSGYEFITVETNRSWHPRITSPLLAFNGKVFDTSANKLLEMDHDTATTIFTSFIERKNLRYMDDKYIALKCAEKPLEWIHTPDEHE